MVLTKNELIYDLERDTRILLHLVSKVEPRMLDYRPTPKQRSLLELLQYLVIMPPIHTRLIKEGPPDMKTFQELWQKEEAVAKAMDLEQIKAAIARHPAVLTEIVNSMSDADLRQQLELFGDKTTRGMWLVNIVLAHNAAYRMQLFLYLKACGREELNTMDLWVGDQAHPAAM